MSLDAILSIVGIVAAWIGYLLFRTKLQSKQITGLKEEVIKKQIDAETAAQDARVEESRKKSALKLEDYREKRDAYNRTNPSKRDE